MPVLDRTPPLDPSSSDDLPRTLRREREARDRAQGRSTASSASSLPHLSAPQPTTHDYSLGTQPQPATVTGFDVPFIRLMLFSIKAVLAAIPALILLGVILWGAGHLLMTYFPWLVKLQILIRVPN